MNKRTALFLTAFILLATAAIALNGSVLSITPGSGGTGSTGQIQCIYSTQDDATNHKTQWKMRRLPSGVFPPSWRNVGDAPVSITTGSGSLNYEILFQPTDSRDTFKTTNPQAVTISCNRLTTVTIHYQ